MGNVKKHVKKPAPAKIVATVSHCVFVKENKTWLSITNPIKVQDVQRIRKRSDLKKELPAVVAILMVDDNDDVLDVVTGKVHSVEQFNLLMQEFDVRAAKKEKEKEAEAC